MFQQLLLVTRISSAKYSMKFCSAKPHHFAFQMVGTDVPC